MKQTDNEHSEIDTCPTCGALLAPSDAFPWHYPDEDCRALRTPVDHSHAR